MAYIGNTPAEAFSAFQKQDFTTSATTSYTLDHPVSNQNEIALFINFVRQEPTTAYTASGTSLTLTSATSSSDDMYCVYLGKAVQTVNPAIGSVGNSQVASTIITGQTAETSIATDDTVLIHDTSAGALRKMTRANFVSGVGGTNTPAFEAYLSSDQNPSNDTETKIQFNTERFDTDNNYDNSSNYRFTPTTAGKYYVYSIVRGGPSSGLSACEKFFLYIYKNGSLYGPGVNVDYRSNNGTSVSLLIASTIDFNGSSDYVEIYANIDVSSGTPTIYADRTIFGAYKILT